MSEADTAQSLGRFIREQRERWGWSQVELAERVTELGYPMLGAYVSQIETGKTKWPGPRMRRTIAQALGVSHLDMLIAAGEIDPGELSGTAELPPLQDDQERAVQEVATKARRVRWNEERLDSVVGLMMRWIERDASR